MDIGNIAFLYDTQKALDAYEKAIELDSSNIAAWNRLGHVFRRLGRLSAALEPTLWPYPQPVGK
ncbi:MAG: tetratricopeptide repeat protein [Desulfohalobiaceae bacterium]|nr:tetratricopeptide repeat protein [Desulfohalobiaceae bacterium]